MIEVHGTNCISPAVDVTNFVNVELGQPLHIFDASKVAGKIDIRLSRPNETAHLLFTESEVTLPTDTLVIADDAKILAVAGVIGCVGSSPDANSKRIYLESATFDPVKVRKAARHLKLTTAASVRFERGGDTDLAIKGAQRAIYLLESLGWDAPGPIEHVGNGAHDAPLIPLSIASLNHFFDTDFSSSDILQRLQRYGFILHPDGKEHYQVAVPQHRIWDVASVEDIYEEVAKSVGFENFPSEIPKSIGALPNANLKMKEQIENILIGEGFFEVFMDGFYSEQHRTRLQSVDGQTRTDHVAVKNAVAKSYAFLKNNCLAQAVELVKTNQNSKSNRTCVYEWTRIFVPKEDKVDEQKVLWAIAAGKNNDAIWDEQAKPIDFYYVKGLVEQLIESLGLPLEVKHLEQSDSCLLSANLHPGRRAGIYHLDNLVGLLGEVHPKLLAAWKVQSARPCFFQIFEHALHLPNVHTTYQPPSNIQSVTRDVCIILPKQLSAQNIADSIASHSSWIEKVSIVDVFSSEKTGHKNAVTFSLVFHPGKLDKASFTGEEINQETERLVERIQLDYADHALERG